MEIRPISAEAARAVRLPILRAGHPPHTAMFPEDDNPRTVHLGAFDDERLVAVATFFPEACAARPGVPAYRLRGMATLRMWQRRGVGRALLQAGTELAENAGARALWCHARSTARGFYERAGFETEGDEFELPLSGKHHVMIKDLREPSWSEAGTPLSKRPVDWVFLAFWAINFGFITYMVDIEQIVIADPARFTYPIWPPRFAVDAIHWWSRSFDPVVWNRAPWYRATIWIDALVFGPFYLFAIYAFVRGRNWIRTPAMVWAGMMIAVVTIILFEELAGPTPTPAPLTVVGANLPWLLFPFAVIWRLRKQRSFGPDRPDLA